MSKRIVIKVVTQIALVCIIFTVIAAIIDPHTMTILAATRVILLSLTSIISGRWYLRRTELH